MVHAVSQTATKTTGSMGKNILIAVLGLVVLGLLVVLMIDPAGNSDAAPATTPTPDNGAPTEGDAALSEDLPEHEPNPEYDAFLLSLPDRFEGDPMAKGAVDAPVVLIEWADYQCGYCQQFALHTHPQLQPYVDSGELRIEYRDVVIFGEGSLEVSAAARAAANQDLFWEFHDVAYAALGADAGPITDELLAQWAEQAGVTDLEQWEAHFRSDEIRQAVAISSLAADELGITSTPTFVVGTEVIMGAQPIEVFQQVIDRQIAAHN